MKFIQLVNSHGQGSQYDVDLNDPCWFVKDYAQYKKSFSVGIRKNEVRLDMQWNYLLLYKGRGLYEFHSEISYEILEVETQFRIEDLREIIIATHNLLQIDFHETQKAFPMFLLVNNLSDEEVELNVRLLSEVLFQQKS